MIRIVFTFIVGLFTTVGLNASPKSNIVIKNLTDLPETSEIINVSSQHVDSNKYDLVFSFSDANYQISNVKLPHIFLDSENRIKRIIKMTYSSVSTKMLRYEVTSDTDNSDWRPYCEWDLTTGNFKYFDKLKLIALANIHYVNDSYTVWFDVIFPFKIDDVREISLSYEFDIIRWWWRERGNHTITRYKGDYVRRALRYTKYNVLPQVFTRPELVSANEHIADKWTIYDEKSDFTTSFIPEMLRVQNVDWNDGEHALKKDALYINDIDMVQAPNILDRINAGRTKKSMPSLTHDEVFLDMFTGEQNSIVTLYGNFWDARPRIDDINFDGLEILDDISVVTTEYQRQGEWFFVPEDDIETEGIGDKEGSTGENDFFDFMREILAFFNNINGWARNNFQTIISVIGIVVLIITLPITIPFLKILIVGLISLLTIVFRIIFWPLRSLLMLGNRKRKKRDESNTTSNKT